MVDVHRLSDVAAGDADVVEHAVIQPVEDPGGGVAALPLEDRLKDVFHGCGSFWLSAALAEQQEGVDGCVGLVWMRLMGGLRSLGFEKHSEKQHLGASYVSVLVFVALQHM